jgi:hypothetical protein
MEIKNIKDRVDGRTGVFPSMRYTFSVLACTIAGIIYNILTRFIFEIEDYIRFALVFPLIIFLVYFWRQIIRWGRTKIEYRNRAPERGRDIHFNLLYMYIIGVIWVIFEYILFYAGKVSYYGESMYEYIFKTALAHMLLSAFLSAIISGVICWVTKKPFVCTFYTTISACFWVSAILIFNR